MKKSYQDSTRLQLNLNEHVLNGEDEGRIFRCTREVRKRESTSLGAQLFAPVQNLSPIYRKHSPNVSPHANDSTTPGASQKSFILPTSFRSERTLGPNGHSILQSQLQLSKNKVPSQVNLASTNSTGYSPISKRLFQAEMRSFTPQTAKNDESSMNKNKSFYTQRSEPKVSMEEMDRAKKWINQCISEKKKKKSAREAETAYSTLETIFSKKKKGPVVRSYKGKSAKKARMGDLIDGNDQEEQEPHFNYISTSQYESEMRSPLIKRIVSMESFRQLVNDEMVLHKNFSYKELNEKWQRVQLIPQTLEHIHFSNFYEQLDRPEDVNEGLMNMTNKAVDRFKKKELWLMAMEMEKKIAALLENGIYMEENHEELQERISGLEIELTRRKRQEEDRQKQLGSQNTSLSRRNVEQRDLIEKLIHEKDGLSRTCKELSEALTVVRSQHEAAVKNLKESFEARFTSKIAEVYEKKEKELQHAKECNEEDLKKVMAKYEESLLKFRKKYNLELQGIQSQLNIKTNGQTEVEDRLVHLKSFVHDLITRLKQREVRCFELESETLKLKESLNSVTSDRSALFRRLEIVKNGYKDNLQKLKKEYRRQFFKGVDTLTSGGLINAKKTAGDSEKLEELSIHGHVNITLKEDDDVVMQRINFMMKEIGRGEEETRV